jgi:hypothetical protein
MTFKTQGYEVVRNAIPLELAKNLALQFQMLRDTTYFMNQQDPTNVGIYGDIQVAKAFVWYGFFGFEALLLTMKDAVERVTGKTLYPTYSYARIYYKGAEMAKHTDRPSCQYSLTMTLDTDGNEPWEIWMRGLDGQARDLKLSVGDMCVYSGDKLEHWRTEFQGTKQIQVFLHYVDANGIYSNHKFDKRQMLGLPK